MRKFFLTLIGVLLLSTAAFGSDRVLFKMVMTNTSDQSVAAQTAQDLSDYAFFIGGSGEIYNGQINAANVIWAESSTGYSRLTNTSGYLHITLNRALRAGDVISYTNGSKDTNKMLITTTASRGGGINVEPNGSGYTINSSSALKEATELYFWYGSNINSTTYIHSLTITTSSEEVVYYDFEDETTGDFTSSSNDLVNGLVAFCKLDDSSPKNGIVAKSSCGYTKMLYMKGNTKERSLKLTVSDPCTIEVWAIGSANERSIYLTDDNKSMGKWTMATFTNNTSLIRGFYNFTGTSDGTDLYISSSSGAMHIAAIRIIYNKIRPTSDLSVNITDAVLQRSNNVVVTATSSSDQTITRANVTGTELVSVSGSNAAGSASYTVTAKNDATLDSYYKFKLYQSGSADYRPDTIYISIRIVNANESVADIDGTVAPETTYMWKSEDNITLIDESKSNDGIARYGAIGEFAANSSLRLANGKTFTLSVPSNKQIARVTFSGYTSQEGTGSITPNGGSPTAFNEKTAESDGEIKHISYDNINAQSFSFTISGKNVAVKIDLVTTDLGYYPVTFGSNWASFCAPEDVVLPEGVYAYIASSNDAETITVNKVEGNLVPANTGVLLYSETLPTCHVTATTGAPALDGNILQYTTARTARPASGTTYALNGDEGCFQEYTGNYVPANKAYVHIPAAEPGSAPKRLRLVVEGTNTTTGVENAQFTIHNSQFTKVIENGQLVIIRDGVKYNVQGQLIK